MMADTVQVTDAAWRKGVVRSTSTNLLRITHARSGHPGLSAVRPSVESC